MDPNDIVIANKLFLYEVIKQRVVSAIQKLFRCGNCVIRVIPKVWFY